MTKPALPTKEFAWSLLAFCLVCLVLFAPSVFSSKSIFAGDAPGLLQKDYSLQKQLTHYYGNWRNVSLGIGVGATPLNPLRAARDIGAFHAKHQEITYILAVLLIFMGTAYYLSALGVPRAFRYTAGIALAFSGYSFTLIAAGHHNFFHMMAYVVFLFGFIEKGIRSSRFIYFALMGTFVMWGISVQPDMMIPISVLAGIYALFSFSLHWKTRPRPERAPYLRRALAGCLVAAVFIGLFGLGSFRFLFETVIPQRDTESGQTAEQRWIFSTNWSMPPSEVIEFISPRIFGNDSEDRKTPYWGELGRPLNWDKSLDQLQQHYQRATDPEQKNKIGQQLQRLLSSRNFRQHNVYLGVLSIVFSLFALAWALTCARGKEAAGIYSETALSWRPYIYFWAAVIVLSILFSFGRYAPFYQVLYGIPYLNKLRAPVKYLRLAEMGLSFLFGIGAAVFLEMVKQSASPAPAAGKKKQPATAAPSQNLLKGFYIATLAVAGIFLLALLISFRTRLDLNQTWLRLGLGAYRDALFSRYAGALLHSFLLFGGCALLFYLSRIPRHAARLYTRVPALLLIVICIDVTISSKPYIRVRDKSPYYASNPMAEYIKEKNPYFRVDNLLPGQFENSALQKNWQYHSIRSMRPPQRNVPRRTAEYFEALAQSPQRLWTLTSTPFILGDRRMLGSQQQALGLEEIMAFNIQGEHYTRSESPQARFALYAYEPVLNPASVFHHTRLAAEDEVMSLLKSADWDPLTTLLVEQAPKALTGSRQPSPAAITSRSRTKTTVETDISEPGVLMVTESYHPDMKVYVNGKRQPLIRCNAVMQGVELAPGKQVVTFVYRPYLAVFIINLGATLVVLVWWLGVALTRRQKTSPRAGPE